MLYKRKGEIMNHEKKLIEVFKQLSFLHLQALKQMSEEQIDELYQDRPFQKKTPDEKNESHDPEVEKDFNDVIKNY